MCGLAAIYNYHYAATKVDIDCLQQMSAKLAHRGPDGDGLWCDPEERVALAHRRLAIVDLAQRSDQPMVQSTHQLTVVFNGEIYNHEYLRERFSGKGYRFKTKSDTEVILAAYHFYGKKMFTHLRGMFSFVLWDGKRNMVLAARDPWGIKPLYYVNDGWKICFASEIKALKVIPDLDLSVDSAAYIGFHLFGSVPEQFTWHRNMQSLSAGHYMVVEEAGIIENTCYASTVDIFSSGKMVKDRNGIPSRIHAAILDSVKSHMVADVPVCLFLSAGIDSGTLLSCLKESGHDKVMSISLQFENAESLVDESILAARLCKEWGMPHTSYRITQSYLLKEKKRFLKAMDQPTVDGFNTWLICAVAKKMGYKVALSGVGGDELFGGYPSFSRIPRLLSITRLFPLSSHVGKLLRYVLTALNFSRLSIHPKVTSVLEYSRSFAHAYLLNRAVYLPWELKRLTSTEMVQEGAARLDWESIVSACIPLNSSVYQKISALEANLYLKNQLLKDSDWASMAHGVELRTPLVDYELSKKIIPLISQYGSAPNKLLLWNGLKYPLPDYIVNKRKSGFEVPINNILSIEKMPRETNVHWSRPWTHWIAEGFSK